MKRVARGFTIVELLIVIIVIAILASISIVAFNGVQERAYNVRVVSDAQHWLESIQLYSAYNGKSMPFSSMPATGLYTLNACLGGGQSYPAKTSAQPYISNNYCVMGSNLSASINDTFLQPFRDANSAVDAKEYNPRMIFYYPSGGGSNTMRGMWYQYGRNSAGVTSFSTLYYILSGSDADCVLAEATKMTGRVGAGSTGTLCIIDLKDTFQIVPASSS